MYVQFVSVGLFPAVVFLLIVFCAICRLAATLYKTIKSKSHTKKGSRVDHPGINMTIIRVLGLDLTTTPPHL